MLIDEKGRLFGWVNLIDFLVVMFIILFIPLIIMCYQFGKDKNPKDIKREPVEVELKFNVIPELAAILKEGDTNYDIWGRESGKIIKVVSIGEDKMGRGYVEARLLLSLMCDVRSHPPRYYGEVLRIGTSGIVFSTELYSISGTVIGIRRLTDE